MFLAALSLQTWESRRMSVDRRLLTYFSAYSTSLVVVWSKPRTCLLVANSVIPALLTPLSVCRQRSQFKLLVALLNVFFFHPFCASIRSPLWYYDEDRGLACSWPIAWSKDPMPPPQLAVSNWAVYLLPARIVCSFSSHILDTSSVPPQYYSCHLRTLTWHEQYYSLQRQYPKQSQLFHVSIANSLHSPIQRHAICPYLSEGALRVHCSFTFILLVISI